MNKLSELPKRPLVSIIVPSYNQGGFIGDTLESIVCQSYRPIEVLVIDGASTDNTIDVLEEYAAKHPEVMWWSEEDDGVADAVNKGMNYAKGEILCIQSSDDLYFAEALRIAVEQFHRYPDCGMFCGHSDAIDSQGRHIGSYQVPEFSWTALFGFCLCLPQQSIFFRKECAEKIGGWRREIFCCDLDFWLRLMLVTQARRVDYIFSAYRVYPEQRTQPRHYYKIVTSYRRMLAEASELRQFPKAIRRSIRASLYLIAVRFPPENDLWKRRKGLLRAFLLYPQCVRYLPREQLVELLPLRKFLKRFYSLLLPHKSELDGVKIGPGFVHPENQNC